MWFYPWTAQARPLSVALTCSGVLCQPRPVRNPPFCRYPLVFGRQQANRTSERGAPWRSAPDAVATAADSFVNPPEVQASSGDGEYSKASLSPEEQLFVVCRVLETIWPGCISTRRHDEWVTVISCDRRRPWLITTGCVSPLPDQPVITSARMKWTELGVL
ncbi:uncharacterized protein BDR25DRAFT_318002 [Lindgomyces ingoldianus]|uniref:Uncharacterized protein n=1 Tax=Lindgomyces ingoldianus TaxID=673940 RepID=A0ACB6QI75_9PLEO|nr:uncharacterized protein BDR25DRAFT_318002 [Lindgomyces ingoldianus]KAF2465845.1 hypothetical protein BDR25DRAFT_318002 [Lindgomyces ingoldianus]